MQLETGTLREAVAADIPSIQRVRHSVRENRLVSTVITDDDVRRAIEVTGRGWVIEFRGEIVAFAVGIAATGNIWALFVHPDHERRGYGRRLHDAMVGWLWEQGLERLWLTTAPETRAQGFYEAAGWQRGAATDRGELRYELPRAAGAKTGGRAAIPMQLRIRDVDFSDPTDAGRFVAVLDSYASDPIGGGEPLALDVRERLIPALQRHPTALVLLACMENEPAGIAVCFFGFSTFRARPLLNVHDLAVVPEYRGQGVGGALLRECENRALRAGCCKLTLEVQDNNLRARSLYERFGFRDFVVADSAFTRFLSKPLG